ncbi:hypothetical protein CONLIGDRAFT_492708 [Coniochaeta ligniaria NRRL 30616]|uniref:NACHT-NTPase and P-loop NTPases N-terminal domain-containing protein n=1 Tax=Coniochaeta ligniaria NRRL 30616 TaxID=1408157 RepID=A0A1J7II27_9PEZI|nr:hypothetical protein CONLIGDRAFT_492708 [Coniochaeta ligniaria NRRL 30616]
MMCSWLGISRLPRPSNNAECRFFCWKSIIARIHHHSPLLIKRVLANSCQAMAEVIGVAASGIALAGVAGKIMTTSLAIKRLLDDVAELPETFTLLLDHIEVLTPVLVQASSDATGISTTPSALDRALGAAAAQCSKALDQLKSLASDLSEQIEQSRGFRRRLVAVKIALRKDVIVKHEKRLHNAVKVLSIAQQTYILSIQRMQPVLLASLIVDELEARKSSSSSSLTCQVLTAEHPDPYPTAAGDASVTRTRNKGRAAVATRPAMRLGLQKVTGLIEIQVPVSVSPGRDTRQSNEDTDGEVLLFGVKIQLPSWLSSRILDSAVYQTHVGWTHDLRTYNTLRGTLDDYFQKGTPWERATKAMKRDDLVMLRQLFASRVLTPFDEYQITWWDGTTSQETLLDLAIDCSAWIICNYLVKKGVRAHGMVDPFFHLRDNTEEAMHHCTRFLQNDEVEDRVRFMALNGLSLPLQAFTDLRRSIWSDEDFNADWNRPQRLEFITFIIIYGYGIRNLTVDVVGPVLFNDPEILSTEGEDLLETLIWGIVKCVVKSGNPESEMYDDEGLLEAYLTLTKGILLRCSECYEGQFMRRIPDCLRETLLTPLWSIDISYSARHLKFSSRLARAELAWHTWLRTLEDAGIDLELYGETEQDWLESHGDEFGVSLPFYTFRERTYNYGSTLKARLIGIQHGPRAQDWRLFWTEPTDAFVGEFWRGVEREVPLMPGSWIEDEEYESESDKAPRLFPCPRVHEAPKLLLSHRTHEDTVMPHPEPEAAG